MRARPAQAGHLNQSRLGIAQATYEKECADDDNARLGAVKFLQAYPIIKPSRIGFEMRTFNDVNCDHVDKVVSEI